MSYVSVDKVVPVDNKTITLPFPKAKDEYGERIKLARPLPLEYLLIELTTTTPIKPNPLFPGGNGHFPITNRETQVPLLIRSI